MIRSSSLTLIGMPGCGKTYWGRRLAQEFWIPALDIDDLIVDRAGGRSLPTILSSNNGEQLLGSLENDCLQQVLDLKLNTGTPTIVSTGGSAVYADCATEFFGHPLNFVLHLDVGLDDLIVRTENFTNRGIIFNGMTPTDLKRTRDVLYRQYADVSVHVPSDTTNLPVMLSGLLAAHFGTPLLR